MTARGLTVSSLLQISLRTSYQCIIRHRFVNPFTDTLKPQSNGSLYSNTAIGTQAVDGWTVTFGTARRGLGGLRPRQVPSSLYQI